MGRWYYGRKTGFNVRPYQERNRVCHNGIDAEQQHLWRNDEGQQSLARPDGDIPNISYPIE